MSGYGHASYNAGGFQLGVDGRVVQVDGDDFGPVGGAEAAGLAVVFLA
jgi:hypothetical protein